MGLVSWGSGKGEAIVELGFGVVRGCVLVIEGDIEGGSTPVFGDCEGLIALEDVDGFGNFVLVSDETGVGVIVIIAGESEDEGDGAIGVIFGDDEGDGAIVLVLTSGETEA